MRYKNIIGCKYDIVKCYFSDLTTTCFLSHKNNGLQQAHKHTQN